MVNNSIEIVLFSDKNQRFIKDLNYEWLEKYFKVENGDVITLSDPKKHIIHKGGHIFYAKFNNEIVGTVSLIKSGQDVFELGKMAVTEKAQGHGVGTFLLEFCLKFAKENSMKSLILYSNRKLLSAIHLYKKYGFHEIELEDGLYERADIKMLKIII
jgi:GNAT superfamily N-acetyltransferase